LQASILTREAWAKPRGGAREKSLRPSGEVVVFAIGATMSDHERDVLHGPECDRDEPRGATIGCPPGCCVTVAEASDGCPSTQALADIRPGETVLDLACGGGFDCFLAAWQVGPTGRAIGVDSTPGEVHRARENARRLGRSNVEFRLGEFEHLPVGDAQVDVLLSNHVVHLPPDHRAVADEAHRVLRPGGRLALTCVVATAPLPAALIWHVGARLGCAARVVEVGELERLLREAGFASIRITVMPEGRAFIREWLPGSGAEHHLAAALVEAVRPRGAAA
jgi:arsenite methyltransferase